MAPEQGPAAGSRSSRSELMGRKNIRPRNPAAWRWFQGSWVVTRRPKWKSRLSPGGSATDASRGGRHDETHTISKNSLAAGYGRAGDCRRAGRSIVRHGDRHDGSCAAGCHRGGAIRGGRRSAPVRLDRRRRHVRAHRARARRLRRDVHAARVPGGRAHGCGDQSRCRNHPRCGDGGADRREGRRRGQPRPAAVGDRLAGAH